MDNKLQLRTSSNDIDTPQGLALVRMNERKYPRYGNINPQERLQWMAERVKYYASVTRIRDLDARESILMAGQLDEMIMKNGMMASLTCLEINDAINSGVFGEYGEFRGLSAPNIYGFLKSFLNSEKKQEATEIVRKTIEQRRQNEKEEEQRRIRAEIEEAKRNGSFVPTGKVWFQPKKVKTYDSEHQEMVRQQAREILKNYD